MSERARAIEALTAWRSERPWARRDPNELEIAEVIACGPTQAILESIYEARGVRYTLSPANTRPEQEDPGPDPWSVHLEHHAPPAPGAEVSARLDGVVHMDCAVCSGSGEATCPQCDGAGRVGDGRNSRTCPRCRGRTMIDCAQCAGSGGVSGAPTVWSRIERQRRLRVHEPQGELPVDVFIDLQDAEHGGRVIHEQEADRVVDLKRDGGYRDAATSADPLRQLVQDVGVDHGVPDGGRILRQRLEIRRVPAWEVKLANGRSVWVYGEPPKVWPPGAMATIALRAARIAPYMAAAIAFLAAAIWLTSG